MSTNGELRGFDADNHYYEATDAFTRHIEPEYAKRAMQWAEIDGKTRLLVGGRVNRFIPNPTFNHLAKPGQPRAVLPREQRGRRRCRRAVRRARADRPRVPRPRHPVEGDGRPAHRRRAVLPHARRRHGRGAARRPARGARRVPRVQPLARRGLGLPLPGADLRRALPHAVRRRRDRGRAGVGARPRRPHRDLPVRARAHARGLQVAGRSVVRPDLGAHRRGRASSPATTAATAPTTRSPACGAKAARPRRSGSA